MIWSFVELLVHHVAILSSADRRTSLADVRNLYIVWFLLPRPDINALLPEMRVYNQEHVNYRSTSTFSLLRILHSNMFKKVLEISEIIILVEVTLIKNLRSEIKK